MAETIAAALVQAGWVGATAAGVKAAFAYAAYAYAAYSMYDGQKQARRQRDAARASITDRLVTTRSSAASARIVYGRTRVAGDTIAYIVNHGALREYVTIVIPSGSTTNRLARWMDRATSPAGSTSRSPSGSMRISSSAARSAQR